MHVNRRTIWLKMIWGCVDWFINVQERSRATSWQLPINTSYILVYWTAFDESCGYIIIVRLYIRIVVVLSYLEMATKPNRVGSIQFQGRLLTVRIIANHRERIRSTCLGAFAAAPHTRTHTHTLKDRQKIAQHYGYMAFSVASVICVGSCGVHQLKLITLNQIAFIMDIGVYDLNRIACTAPTNCVLDRQLVGRRVRWMWYNMSSEIARIVATG